MLSSSSALTASLDKRIAHILSAHTFINSDIGEINKIEEINSVVISIPKCGSTAIQRGLERTGHRVLHAHNNPTTYDAFKNGNVLQENGITLEALLQYRLRISTHPLFFFFGYREPVSWYLSLAGNFRLALNKALATNIIYNIHNKHPWCNYPFDWSRSVVKMASGIDPLEMPYDSHRGITINRKNGISVVVYRMDRMDPVEGFIQTNISRDFKMTRERVNSSPDYVRYVNEFKLDESAIRILYADKIFSFFYNEAERDALISKYASPASTIAPTVLSKTKSPDRDPNDHTTWGQVSRNESCPCGSGKRYKHCHGRLT